MTQEDIIRIGREMGLPAFTYPCLISASEWTKIELFAALVAAHEREALLDLVDSYAKNNTDLKDAIRARGQA